MLILLLVASGIVTKEINSVLGSGQIKIGGEVWSAKVKSDITIPEGEEVTITEIDGVKAVVEPISASIIKEKETVSKWDGINLAI